MNRASRRADRRELAETPAPRADDSRLRLLGLAVLCLKLLLVPIVFDYSADVPFTVPKALLSHALTYVLAAILVGLLIRNGPSFVVRSWVHVPVVAFALVSAIATVFAVNPILALYGTHARMLGFGTIADGVITYFAVVHLVRQRRDVIVVLASIFAASAVVVGYEVVQWTGKDPLTWNFDGSLRPFSTIGQPTSLGEYLSMLSVVAFAFASLTREMRRSVRTVLVVYSVLLLLAAGVTGTRSAAVGVVAAGAAFVLIVWAKHPSRRARALSVAGVAGAGFTLGLVLFLTPVGSRLLSTFATDSNDPATLGVEESAGVRAALYGMALEMVRERPIIGYGPDNFAAVVPVYRPAPAPTEIRQSIATSAHSWLAHIATSSGVLGLATFLTIIVAAALVLLRSPFHALAVTAALGAVAYLGSGLTTINSLEIDTLFWVAIAGAASASASTRAAPDGVVPPGRRGRARSRSNSTWLVSWGLVAVAAGMALMTLPTLEASRLAKRSVAARAPSTAAQAVDLATRATQLDPNRAEYWQQLALAFVSAGRWADASTAFKSAAKLAPYDIRFLNDDIQVQLVLSNRGDSVALGRAAQLADQAVQIDPNNPLAHSNRAVVALGRRDLALAVASITRALELIPEPSESILNTASQIYVTAVQTHVAAGNLGEALRAGQTGTAALGTRSMSVPLRVEYTKALLAAGRPGDALAEIDAALRISPDDQAALALRDQLHRR